MKFKFFDYTIELNIYKINKVVKSWIDDFYERIKQYNYSDYVIKNALSKELMMKYMDKYDVNELVACQNLNKILKQI
jgi:protein associated with RNAse G/E